MFPHCCNYRNILLAVALVCLLQTTITAAAGDERTCATKRVVVSGAGGQTGQALFRKLLALPEEFDPLGLVRTEESKAVLVESGVPASAIVVVDVSSHQNVEALQQAAKGCVAFLICTSAKPSPSGEVNEDTGRPIFGFPNGSPEEVDWLGQKHQIDACSPDTHVVLCSTMGGTDANNGLNNFGRTTNEDGTVSGGNIVKWKRKAEVYLMNSGRPYTIVHPGGLVNAPGGERELLIGVDDEQDGTTGSLSIPRDDVAEVMLQAVRHIGEYRNRSFDVRAKPVGEGTPTIDFITLLEGLKGRDCDYNLGGTM
mmetsp:Transcript_2959/g.4813  ORF Transcript_2959/g.4813 Transcript_2959/m.4813 type:complete len:311 (-) Transcript_2959:255-1187(-)|eukprot:CAMPEP_0119016070 /NCGR_PEP_ID=MMETSP1176-20130426/11800_1 /TAXON_ID=265551 /ORGANISM="Synedropsis recta cf, Strain CCMP1620" /LENGTH=310 /DNA_ID=CAMNT_0006969397 /DNA_START=54 /DNA_END=986 /DNA_ORIENTATION=-